MIVCPKCGAALASVNSLEIHLRRSHGVAGRERLIIINDVTGGMGTGSAAIHRYDRMQRAASQTP